MRLLKVEQEALISRKKSGERMVVIALVRTEGSVLL
jgi:hypothetical protein